MPGTTGSRRRRGARETPWGRVAALLTACFITLVCVSRGCDADVVLARAIGGGAAVGFSVAFGLALTRIAQIQKKSAG